LEIVRLIPKKAARLISKVLASAIANAENNNNSENKTLRAENLVVKTAVAGEGPTMKRMHTRARGGGARINKRTAHIKITLTEAEPIEKTVKPKGIKKDKAKPSSKISTKPVASKKTETEASAAPALVAPEPDPSQLRAEAADKTSKSLAAGEHPEKVTAAD
jgi:ribosomal protein L22